MHHSHVSSNFAWLPHNLDPSLPVPDRFKATAPNRMVTPLPNVQTRYEQYLQDCADFYNNRRGRGERCYQSELDRLEMTLRQPQGMHNFTTVGFKKLRAPQHVFDLIRTFWDKNRHKEKLERWGSGNIYVYVPKVEELRAVSSDHGLFLTALRYSTFLFF